MPTPPKEQLLHLYDLSIERTKDLHADVWNGVRFFTGAQVVVLTAVGALSRVGKEEELQKSPLFALLAIAIGSCVLGFYVLWRHRRYYLEALQIKTILENKLGLISAIPYGNNQNHNLALPWTVTEQDRIAIDTDPESWKKATIFKHGTITAALFYTYAGLIVLDIVVIILVASGNF